MNKIKNAIKIVTRTMLLGIFLLTFGPYLKVRHNLRLVKNEAKGLKGPYLFLSNHSNNYDAFFHIFIMRKIIYYVGTDAVFRMPVIGVLLKYYGFIKKRKFVADANTIRNIVKTIREGKIVGIMPEGSRTWDGETLPFFASTSRLIKLLKVPVVMGHIHGGYCSRPRWATTVRRGKMEISVSIMLTPEQIAKMSVVEIQLELKKTLGNDDMAWAQENNIKYKGKLMAESLELFITTCPSCEKFFTMQSKGNHFSCSNCGASMNIDNYYNFTDKDRIPFDTVASWGQWQDAQIKTHITKELTPFISCNDALLESAEGLSAYMPIMIGSLTLHPDRLILENSAGVTTIFSYDKIIGTCVLVGGYLAFQYDLIDYKVSFASGDISAHMWTVAIITASGRSAEDQGLVI